MALVITSNLMTISECDADDWDLGVGTLETDFYKEPTGCLGLDIDIETSYAWKTMAQADWTGRHLYVWLLGMTAGFLDTKANGGFRLCLEDSGGNQGYWYVAGSDTYPGGWRRFIISADTTPNSNNGTDPNKTQIVKVGVGFKGVAKSKLAQNCFWDYVQYDTSASRGVKITGGAPDDWNEVLAQDEAAYIGLIRKEGGVFYLQGTMQFGDAATDINFADVNQVLIYEDIAGSSDFHKIIVIGGAGTTTNFKLGTKSGTQGISGCVIKSAGSPKFQIDADNANIDILGLYGCTLFDAGTISLPPNAANREILNCNIEACAQMIVDTCVVKFCNFISSDAAADAAVLINDDPHNVTDCNFISCPDAVELDTVGDGTYDFDNLKFSGCTYDVNNTSGSALTVNKLNGADPTSYNPGGSAVTFLGSYTLSVTVKDEALNAIQGAQVYIHKTSPTALTSDVGNNAGDADFVVNEAIDADTPQAGWITVWNKAINVLTPYRYQSWATSTFILRAEETGSCTTAGSPGCCQLIDSAADFGGTTDVEEGDTICNTTDGSWAVVDEIVSSTELLTSALQGDGDNNWQLNDAWSVHRLALMYADNDDLVDAPIMNLQTNASGLATKTYTGADVAIIVRIRSNEGATKYLPYNTSGNIVSGYTLTAIMIEDEVAA